MAKNLHLPPTIERPKILYHISPPKPKIPTPTFHTTNERSPKFKELKAKKSSLKDQYLKSLASARRLEAEERRANIQLQATKRLLETYEEKRKMKGMTAEAKSFVEQIRKEAILERRANASGEQSRKEQSRRKMEDLFMMKKAEVDSVKEELQSIKDEHSRARGDLLALNRQLIQQERQRARETKVSYAECHSDHLQKDRERQKVLWELEMQNLKKAKEAEALARTKMAESIKNTLVANQLNRREKNIDKNLEIANEAVVSKKIETHEKLMDFYSTEMHELAVQEAESRRRLEYQTAKLKGLQDEIVGSFTTPIIRYHRKKILPH